MLSGRTFDVEKAAGTFQALFKLKVEINDATTP